MQIASTELERLVDTAHKRWPGIELPLADFADKLGAQPGSDERPPPHAGDLYLAHACLAGDRAALAHLDRLCREVCASLPGRVDLGRQSPEELAADLLAHVVVAREEAKPKLDLYQGRASLARWLAVSAVHLAHSTRRVRAREKPVASGSITQLLGGYDHELSILKSRYRQEVRDAIKTALAKLTPRHRNLLRYHTLEGLSIDQIGVIYRVHRATAARWLEQARARVLQGTRDDLAARLHLSEAEIQSIIELVQSQLDVSLSDLLLESDATSAEKSQGAREK